MPFQTTRATRPSEPMRRLRRWLALALLVGLQAPLCALACTLESPDRDVAGPAASHARMAAESDAGEHPCHAPAEPVEPEPVDADDCTCRGDGPALLAQSESPARTLTAPVVVAEAIPLHLDPVPATFAPRASQVRRAPPPDLLLLKSTLLL